AAIGTSRRAIPRLRSSRSRRTCNGVTLWHLRPRTDYQRLTVVATHTAPRGRCTGRRTPRRQRLRHQPRRHHRCRASIRGCPARRRCQNPTRAQRRLNDSRHHRWEALMVDRDSAAVPAREKRATGMKTQQWSHFSVVRENECLWRVTFNNPPINLASPEMLVELPVLIDQMEAADELRVVVFESANPDYFLNHYDTSRVAETPKDLGVTGYPLVIDTSTRLSRLPVVSIAKIRGRVRGIGNELTLAM